MIPRNFLVFDFETDGVDPYSCNPVQLAAQIVHSKKLEIIPHEKFCTDMKPLGIEDVDKYVSDPKVRKTVEWHAKQQKCEFDDVIQRWREAPDQQLAWSQFNTFVTKQNWKKTAFTAPIACGMNIRNFDLIICKKLNDKYGIKTMFWKRDQIDLLDLFFYWFENLEDGPKSHNMDTIREYFGMSAENAHDAMKDVQDCAEIICRFMRVHRKYSQRITFKGAFKDGK